MHFLRVSIKKGIHRTGIRMPDIHKNLRFIGVNGIIDVLARSYLLGVKVY